MKDHGLSDPDACESRRDIMVSICEDTITLNEDNNCITISLDDFLCEIEQRCQDSLHNIFDESKQRSDYVFETLAEITRPDPVSQYMRDLIEKNSRSDADPGL